MALEFSCAEIQAYQSSIFLSSLVGLCFLKLANLNMLKQSALTFLKKKKTKSQGMCNKTNPEQWHCPSQMKQSSPLVGTGFSSGEREGCCLFSFLKAFVKNHLPNWLGVLQNAPDQERVTMGCVTDLSR